MAPDEVAELRKLIGDVFGKVNGIDKKLGEHIAREDERAQYRAQTCPTVPLVNVLLAENLPERVKKLERWREGCDEERVGDEAVAEAQQSTWGKAKAAWAEVRPVVVAVLVAFLLLKLDLK